MITMPDAERKPKKGGKHKRSTIINLKLKEIPVKVESETGPCRYDG